MNKKTQAFSLIELLIVIALVAVMTTFAVPSMRSFQVNSGLTSNTNELVASLQFARSASIRLQNRVVICSSQSSQTANPLCDTTEWRRGWIIFHDVNLSGGFDSGDEMLRVQSEVVMPGLDITPIDLGGTPTNITTYVSFGPPAGEPTTFGGENQSGMFHLCTDQDLEQGRGVTVHFSGRISSTRENLPPCT